MDLAVFCYTATARFPAAERFGLANQIRRAASSVPANIAEGCGRNHAKEYLQFVGIANGSINELETHVILASQLGLVSEAALRQILEQSTRLGRMLTRLRQSLRHKISNPPPG